MIEKPARLFLATAIAVGLAAPATFARPAPDDAAPRLTVPADAPTLILARHGADDRPGDDRGGKRRGGKGRGGHDDGPNHT